MTRILRLTERRTGRGEEEMEEKVDKGNDIAWFSGENRMQLWGWKVQLVLK